MRNMASSTFIPSSLKMLCVFFKFCLGNISFLNSVNAAENRCTLLLFQPNYLKFVLHFVVVIRDTNLAFSFNNNNSNVNENNSTDAIETGHTIQDTGYNVSHYYCGDTISLKWFYCDADYNNFF